MKNSTDSLNNLYNENNNNELDFNNILECLLRRSKISISVFISIIFVFLVYAFTRKQIWKGQFQIVLNDKSDSLIDNTTVRNFIGNQFTKGTNLNTEVEILKSPSVLMPIFNFVKKQKEINGSNVKGLSFLDWSRKVNVSLKKRTSVLEVTYKDTDRALILPVIRKISTAYESYPGRDKNKGLKKAIKYFEEQIILFKEKSENSYRDYIAFSLENNLKTIPDKLDSDDAGGTDPRVKIQNKIKEYEVKYQEIESLDISSYDDKALPANFAFGGEYYDTYISILNKKVLELSESSQIFTENDTNIKKLKSNIYDLNKIFRKNMLDYISNEIKNLNFRLSLVTKPKNVIIEFKQLQRDVFRLERILKSLEEKKQVIALQLADESRPWELISTPTLNESPVAPKKKQIMLLGLFTGSLLGLGGAFYADKFSGFIYSKNEFRNFLKDEPLSEITLNKKKYWEGSIELIGLNINQSSQNNKLGLVSLNNNTEHLSEIKEIFKKSITTVKLIDGSKLIEFNSYENILLIVQKGKVRKTEMLDFIEKLKLLNKPLLGWILIGSN